VEQCGDGIDNDGDGLIDEGCAAVPLTAPGRPSRLVGTVVGSTVHLRWSGPISGGPATGYVVEAGPARGTTVLAAAVGAATSVSFPAVAPGTYFVRVRAANAAGAGAATDDVAVSPGCALFPDAPRALTSAVSGAAVRFTWQDDRGCAGTRYRLLVGSAPGLSDLGSLASAEPGFEGMAPAGRYFARAVLDWNGGTSAPSNEVAVVVTAGCPPPAVALALSGGATARRLELRWTPTNVAKADTVDAVTPIHYVVEAGASAGASNLGVVPVGRTTALTAAVGPGAYFVRVRAVSACGPGPASNEVTVAVP
jgi:hypothetical protein